MRLVSYVILVWSIGLLCFSLFTSLTHSQQNASSFFVQQDAVRTIMQDAKENKYTVIAYEKSIYQYEFTYLFRWLADKDIPYDPSRALVVADTVYLIVPANNPAELQDFVSYRTPKDMYNTAAIWQKPYNQVIIKQVKNKGAL